MFITKVNIITLQTPSLVLVSFDGLPNMVIEYYWPTHSLLSPQTLCVPLASRGQRFFSYQQPLLHAATEINERSWQP